MNNNLHLSTPFLLKMVQRNITSFFNSPSGNKRSRPSENDDILPSIASDSELGDQNELTVSVTIIGDNGHEHLETETESASSSTVINAIHL